MTTAANSGHGPLSPQQAKAFIEENGIETVLIGGSDVNGIFRSKRIPAWRFVQDPEDPIHFADVMCVMDVADGIVEPPANYEGWFPSWEVGFGDLKATPDLGTLRSIPWADRAALVLCDHNDLQDDPLPMMPRNILRRVVDRARDMDLVPVMTPEFEFTVLAETIRSLEEKDFKDPMPFARRGMSWGAQLDSTAEPLISAIRNGIEGLGIPIEASHCESGPGQFEVNLTPAPAMQAADAGFLFKHAVREISELHGFLASFMAKPVQGGYGSSLHVHQSMQDKGGTNVFFDSEDELNLSLVARQYLAGLVASMREFTAIFAPTVNSYKRFEANAAVGCTVSWSVQSKGVGIRVVNESLKACRIEHRTPGADANPYLVLAAMLAGGLAGIEQDLKPAETYHGNSYVDPDVEWVPRTMPDAITLFEQSEVANAYLGEEAVRFFAATRRAEFEEFNSAVTEWEVRRYLGVV